MTPRVPSREIGTATPGMMVARTLRRNTNTTRITSAIAMASVYSTSRSEARMVVVRSEATASSAPAGIDARSWGSTSFTRSTVSMMLAPRRAVAVGDPEPLVLIGPPRLVVGVELVVAAAHLDGALGAVGVGRRDGRAHVLEPDPVAEERARLELHPHRGQRAAPQVHLADAG